MRRLLAGITSSAFYSDFAPHSLGYAFNSDVSAGLSLDAFTLDHLSGSATLPRSGMSMTWDDGTHTATITPTSAGTPAILADGWYDAIWSEVNSPLTNEHKHTFRWLLGDFNNDGAVGEDDHTYFVSLLTGSGTPNGVGHSAGDVNFDGATNNLDISMFVAQYGKQVPALLRGPGDITAMTLSSTSIRVQWTAPAGATPDGYRIFRSTDGTNFTEIHEADDPLSNTAGFFWDDTTAAHGTKYWYRVRPFTFANGNGHTTPKVSAVTGMPAPVVTHLQGGDQIVRVVWDDHSHTESAFRITLRDTTTNQTFVEDVESDLVSGGTLLGQRSWMMAGLDASATYEVSVAATREGGAITSAAIPFTETVSTNAGQVDSGAGELIVSSYDYRWGNVQMDVNPPVPMLENPGYPDFGPEFYVDPEWPGYQNDPVTITFSNLPKHTFVKFGLSIDGMKRGQYIPGDAFDDVTLNVTAGERSGEMIRNHYPHVPGLVNWNVTSTFGNWFEHVGETLTVTVSGDGFGAVSGGEIGWNIYGMTLTIGTPTVWVEAEDAEAAETTSDEQPNPGSFKFSRSEVGRDRPLSAGYNVSGTATNGEDYESLSGTIKFSPNEATKLLDVVVIDDPDGEGMETIDVSLLHTGAYLVLATQPAARQVVLNDNVSVGHIQVTRVPDADHQASIASYGVGFIVRITVIGERVDELRIRQSIRASTGLLHWNGQPMTTAEILAEVNPFPGPQIVDSGGQYLEDWGWRQLGNVNLRRDTGSRDDQQVFSVLNRLVTINNIQYREVRRAWTQRDLLIEVAKATSLEKIEASHAWGFTFTNEPAYWTNQHVPPPIAGHVVAGEHIAVGVLQGMYGFDIRPWWN